ncbi:MAG: hypothetical protein E7463_07885 [Ruminococcaceae bacterium]|nr:hypothetical protein [Oscillospiraceae bacterium]
MDHSEYRKIKWLLCCSFAAVVFVFSLFFILQAVNGDPVPPYDDPYHDIYYEQPSTTQTQASSGPAASTATPLQTSPPISAPSGKPHLTISAIPAYAGEPYCTVLGNQPGFSHNDLTTKAYETYADLDRLGRCGVTMACVGREIMPNASRESISSVRPSGWVNAQYEFVDGRYLYNRCHLIGFQLTGENANERNLITGTRYLNIEGMLPFENMVADYVRETGNHVMYRVTPLYQGDELVARWVQLEGWSVEDDGEGICFNVCAYNVQPGVIIDYATGASTIDEEFLSQGEQEHFVLNTSSKTIHMPTCGGAKTITAKNREDYSGTRMLLIAKGYKPCGQCKP